jgi:hypothetical protein
MSSTGAEVSYSPDDRPQKPLDRSLSHTSVGTNNSAQSHQEYLATLHVPSSAEMGHISEVQLDREAQIKRRSREFKHRSIESPPGTATPQPSHKKQDSLSSRLFGHRPSSRHNSTNDEATKHRAATIIQRNYRGYRSRREMKGLGLNASTRWTHALRELQYREATRPRARPSDLSNPEKSVDENASLADESAKNRWKRATLIARHAGLDVDDSDSDSDSESESDSDSSSSSGSTKKVSERRRREAARVKRRKNAKLMGLAYFLEMVDLKHRYGSNLRAYHDEWKKADTNENFFYWLDYGEGRYVDMSTCPRDRLDREQVRYLSREERAYYLVKVDDEGRLCWAKNGVRIDTTVQYKDSINGIVPADDPTPAFRAVDEDAPKLLGGGSSSGSDTDSSYESALEADRAAKYATPELDQAKGVKKVGHVSASAIFNKLLRKSVKKNTWIFVADTSFRLYVGIKNSGAFQHSSFLQGSRISAAGLIKIKNGRLRSLSPLSGHYRPPAANFRAFIKSLKEEGVDMKRVSISKAYAVLVGLEAYMKTTQRVKEIGHKLAHQHDKVVDPVGTQRKDEAEKDQSGSAKREREVLAEEERERLQNKTAVKAMQKLHIHPTEPKGQKGAGDDEEQRATAEATA